MIALPPIKKYVMENGLTVLHQRNPISRAFCIGVWTRTGARDERPDDAGLCHFLEHMLFKGTARRSAFDISQDIERIGGSIDAFTTKDTMCVYAQVLEDHREVAIDLISDMVTASVFDVEQVALERDVVLEEISDVMDAPDDLIHEAFAEAIFRDHPLGRPILGFPYTVSKMNRAGLLRYARRVFKGGNVVICVYGNIDEKELRRVCKARFALPGGDFRRVHPRVRRNGPVRRMMRRKLHQQHICIGTRTFSFLEERRYPLMLLTTLLGGGMSSRLFQRIREEKGLCYNLFTYSDHSHDAGLMATYVAVRPRNAGLTIREVVDEFRHVLKDGVTKDELESTREQLKGRILLGLETSTARMMRMARNEISYGRQVSERELIRSIDAVRLSDVQDVARAVLEPKHLSIVSMGPSSAGLRSASY